MDSKILRQKYIEFFERNGHQKVAASSLAPQNDPSVLFTTAGMQQFKRFYLHPEEAPAQNIVTCQPCFRTSDIEEVGDDTHLTFFEMLGNFSFGGYFKEEAIKVAYQFLVEELNIEKTRISSTIFAGDNEISRDSESAKILDNMGLKYEEHGRADNFWSLGTENSPGGPTVEFYIDGTEIWNLVFNEYLFQNGKYELSKHQGVDTGMGLERLLAVLENKNIYETDLFSEIIKKIENLSDKKYQDHQKDFRIIADHLKAATFAIKDGIFPSNKEAGYIIRRLVRRAIVMAKKIEIENDLTSEVAKTVFQIYPDVMDTRIILEQLDLEERKFRSTLEQGLRQFEKIKNNLDGQKAFDLYQTYGFPWEMTFELAKESGISVNFEDFKKAFETHQKLSRTASAGMFKGGLSSGGEMETKYHTATHLLLAALRQVLGKGVRQKGSNITNERLRLDFSYPEKLEEEELKKVEDLVNAQIKADLPVSMEEMNLEDAQKCGAIGEFGEKYGYKVKVYSMGSFSREICGGPHVEHTGELGTFKIIKEESSSSGVRRIKAILE